MTSQERHPTAGPSSPLPARRYRAALFQVCLLVASAVFVALALLARGTPYFSIDLTITRAVQRIGHPAFAALMFGVSWLGFLPQILWLGAAVIAGLLAAGLRWEAAGAAFAGGAGGVTTLVKLIILRPRPSPDLVRVLNELSTSSFPSGHVMVFTSLCGFLLFLAYRLLKPSWGRTALMVVLGLVIVLMGPSRIYLGHHWFSDVIGAYLLGSLWLVLTIKFYRWGKPRFFAGQPAPPPTE